MSSALSAEPSPPPPEPAAPPQEHSFAAGARAAVSFFVSRWHVFLFSITAVGVLIGWVGYGISPIYRIQEIAHQQAQARTLRRMIDRHLRLGHRFLNVGQLAAARAEYERALKLDPASADAQLGILKAEVFEPIAKKDYIPEIAEKRIQLILEENPDDPHALSFLGSVYSNIDTAKADEYYQRAIDHDPDIAMAYYERALMYDQVAQPDKALPLYERAVKLSPWNQVYLENLSYQYYQKGLYDKTVAICELMRKLNGSYLLAYYTIALAHEMIGDVTAADSDLATLIKLVDDRDILGLSQNQGTWFFNIKDWIIYINGDARKTYYAYYHRALVLHLINRFEESQALVNKARALKAYDEASLQLLLRADVEKLAGVQTKWRPQLETFRARFL